MKRKFIFVAASQNIGGADFSMNAIIKMLEEKGIESLVIVSKEGKIKTFWNDQNVQTLYIPFKRWIVSNKRKRIGRILYELKTLYHIYLVKKYKRTIKEKCKDCEIACIYNNGFTNNFASLLAGELKVPYVQHIREFGDKDFGWNFELGKLKQYEKIQKKAKLIVAISNAVKESFLGAHGFERINVVYNGVKRVEIKKDYTNNSKVKIVISGRLVKEKGHIEVLKALVKLKEAGVDKFIFDIYGEGVEKNNIQKFIKNNNLENYVNLKGFVYGIKYEDYDVGIMSSKSEAFGRVTAEYMMNGLVTIATNSGANPELISNNKDGLLYSNMDELVSDLKRVIRDENFRKSIGIEAQKSANLKYAEDVYLENIFQLLKQNSIL